MRSTGDVAFSCGGTLARLVASGWRSVVATVFTRSVARPTGFALACQTDKGLAADADYMALRRSEDRAFADVVGAETLWLDFVEAPHRGYASAADLFNGPRSDDRQTIQTTAAALGRLIASLRPSHVFAPLALGAHVDHVLVADAVRSLSLSMPVAWYRDMPYAMRSAGGGAMHAVAIDSAHLATKLHGCAAYRTQLDFQFGGVAAMHAALTRCAADEAAAAGLHATGAERFTGNASGLPGHGSALTGALTGTAWVAPTLAIDRHGSVKCEPTLP